MTRKWRKRLAPVTLIIGIVLYAFGFKYNLIGVMIMSAFCIVGSLISLIY